MVQSGVTASISIIYNRKDNPGDVWHLRLWLQFWQLRTWIHDNICYLTINCDTGQHSQFLRCLMSVSVLSVLGCALLNSKWYSWTLLLQEIWLNGVQYCSPVLLLNLQYYWCPVLQCPAVSSIWALLHLVPTWRCWPTVKQSSIGVASQVLLVWNIVLGTWYWAPVSSTQLFPSSRSLNLVDAGTAAAVAGIEPFAEFTQFNSQ